MSLIMENWRQFSDLEKLNEEYEQFCETYDRYIALNESEQDSFLLDEKIGGFGNIIDFFKELASTIGTHWRGLVELFKSNDGILWKVLKLLGWSLASLGEAFDAAFEAINTIQRTIIDFVQENPITGLKGQQLTDWLKLWFKSKSIGNLSKFVFGAILLGVTVYYMINEGEAPFSPSLVIAAFTGKFTAVELLEDEEGGFAKMVFAIAGGVALSAAFPAIGLLSIGALGVIRKLASGQKFVKWATGKKTQKGNFAMRTASRRKARAAGVYDKSPAALAGAKPKPA